MSSVFLSIASYWDLDMYITYVMYNNVYRSRMGLFIIAVFRNGSTYQYHYITSQWRHNDHDSVSNHQPHGCLLNRLFRRRSKKTSKFRVTGLCVGNSPGPVNSPHKGPVTRKMFPFYDVIMPPNVCAIVCLDVHQSKHQSSIVTSLCKSIADQWIPATKGQ